MQNPPVTDSSDPSQHRSPAPAGDPMLAARLAVPALPKILIRRPALLARLTAGLQDPLTLVNGPAGAGKTVLVAHWLSESRGPGPIVWLTLEPDDAPGAFWAYVLEGLHRNGVRLPDRVGRPARAEGVDRSLLVHLAEALAASPEPVVLVLDRLDAVPSRDIAEGLAFVLSHACGGLRLVLTSRTEPMLPLHLYRASGAITEIRNADLRFTGEEIGLLLKEHGLEVSEAGVGLLAARTDGWAAGLRLVALAMQRSPDPETFARQFAADRTTIADYLITEVLDAQPLPLQELLLRVSIADRIHPDLADVLTGRRDADWALADLAHANAFLEQLDGSAWYRLHPLFAEVLHAHLRHRRPGLEPVLRARAARWLAEAGRLTEAVAQAAEAGDWQFAAGHLVDDLAIGRLITGLDTEQLRRTFAAMPEDLDEPAPALVRAAGRLADHDLEGCAADLRLADEHLESAGPAARLCRAFVGMLAAGLAGDPEAAGREAADAGRLLPEVPQGLLDRHPEIPAMLMTGLGAAELGAGRLDTAEGRLLAAVEACRQPGLECPLTDALGSLAVVELLRGRLRGAEQHARWSLTAAERSALPPERRSGLGHLVLAGVATEHDELDAARAELALATAAARTFPQPVAVVESAVIGARLATAAGDWEDALAMLGEAGSTSARCLPDWAADELAIAASAAHLAHGDAVAALDALDVGAADRPEHTVATARALLAAGERDRALDMLAGLPADDPAAAAWRVRACLLRAQAMAESGGPDEARRLLAEALALARPEEQRRVFTESGPWLRQLLRREPQLARAHSWLPAHLVGPPWTGTGTGTGSYEQLPLVVESLSARESEVLRQAAQMLTTEEIAAQLYLSGNTVKTHLKSIYRKLSVTRRSEAVRRARDLGMM